LSKTIYALGIKYLFTLAFGYLAFTIPGQISLGWVALIALGVAGINYLLGDLFVLPAFGNIVAALGDGAMGALTFWIFDMMVIGIDTSLTTLITFAALVAVGEYFFHNYLFSTKKVAPN